MILHGSGTSGSGKLRGCEHCVDEWPRPEPNGIGRGKAGFPLRSGNCGSRSLLVERPCVQCDAHDARGSHGQRETLVQVDKFPQMRDRVRPAAHSLDRVTLCFVTQDEQVRCAAVLGPRVTPE